MKPKPSKSGPEEESPPRGRADGDSATQGAPDFAALVEAYYIPLYRFGLTLARCEHEAIDLTQQTFYVWACKGHQLRDPGKAKVWLFSVLRHEFLKRQRHQGKFMQSESSIEDACAEDGDSTSMIDQLDGSVAQQALLSLDDLYREPLTLFYLQQHSYQEIAQILEIPIGEITHRQFRRFHAREQQRAVAYQSERGMQLMRPTSQFSKLLGRSGKVSWLGETAGPACERLVGPQDDASRHRRCNRHRFFLGKMSCYG